MNNNVLITGAAGFIGKNLSAFLEHRGFKVTRFDKILGHSGYPDILDQDIVIHLGANSSTTETNLSKIVVKFQYASSASVYGISRKFKETDFCKPLSPYAFSKYMFDCWLLNQDYPYQGFRYFNVYGLGEENKGNQSSPVSTFIQQAQRNGEIKLFENSEKYKRDFVSVDDVCEMHYRMLSEEVSGVYNVGTSCPISFRDVAEIVKQNISCTITEIPMPKQLKGQYQKFTKADNSKLMDVCGDYEWQTVQQYIEQNKDSYLQR